MEMLSVWLKMTNPPPTWEALVTALQMPTVAYPDIAKKVEEESERLDKSAAAGSVADTANPSGSGEF